MKHNFSLFSHIINFILKGNHERQVYIYPTPPPHAGCDTKSILKWSKASLNTEFVFFGGGGIKTYSVKKFIYKKLMKSLKKTLKYFYK